MKVRTFALVAALAVALVIGSFGTATAAGLSKKAVKKIAAKVVAQQAPSLSVAHAATAGSATTASDSTRLAGQPASAYQESTRTYAFPVNAGNGNKSFGLTGLPAGTWLVSYSASVTTGSPIRCYVHVVGVGADLGASTAVNTGGRAACTGSVQVTTDGINPPQVNVEGSNLVLENAATALSSAVVTKVDSTQPGTATQAP